MGFTQTSRHYRDSLYAGALAGRKNTSLAGAKWLACSSGITGKCSDKLMAISTALCRIVSCWMVYIPDDRVGADFSCKKKSLITSSILYIVCFLFYGYCFPYFTVLFKTYWWNSPASILLVIVSIPGIYAAGLSLFNMIAYKTNALRSSQTSTITQMIL